MHRHLAWWRAHVVWASSISSQRSGACRSISSFSGLQQYHSWRQRWFQSTADTTTRRDSSDIAVYIDRTQLNITDAIHVATGARIFICLIPRAGIGGVDNFIRTVQGGGSGGASISLGARIILSANARNGNQIATCSLARPLPPSAPACCARNCLLYNYTTAMAAADATDATNRPCRCTVPLSSVNQRADNSPPLFVATVDRAPGKRAVDKDGNKIV